MCKGTNAYMADVQNIPRIDHFQLMFCVRQICGIEDHSIEIFSVSITESAKFVRATSIQDHFIWAQTLAVATEYPRTCQSFVTALYIIPSSPNV